MVPQFLESPQERPIFCDTKQADDPEAKTQAIRHAFGQTGIWWRLRCVIARCPKLQVQLSYFITFFASVHEAQIFVVAVVMAIQDGVCLH